MSWSGEFDFRSPEHLGIDPYADDAWVDFLDINPRDLPIIGPAR